MIPPRRFPLIDIALNSFFSASANFAALLGRVKTEGPLNLRDSRSPASLVLRFLYFKRSRNWDKLVEINEHATILGSGVIYPRGFWSRICSVGVCSAFHSLVSKLVDSREITPLHIPSLTTTHLIYLALPQRDVILPKLLNFQQKLLPYASGANLPRTTLKFKKTDLDGITPYWMRFFDSWKRHVSSVECEVPIDPNTVLAVMAQCRVRNTRQLVFDKFMEISNPPEKTRTILDLLILRKQMANSLGKKSWSDLEAQLLGAEDHLALEKELVEMWKKLLPAVKDTLKRMNPSTVFSKSELGPLTESINFFDEANLLEKVIPVSGQEIWENLAATPENVLKIFQLTGKLFGVTFEPVVTRWLREGWPKDSLIFKCSNGTSNIGYVYVNLWRQERGSAIAGSTPLGKGHVKLSLELHKGGIFDKHFFSGDFVALMMHEVAHAIHHLVYPGNSFNQQPLDFIELPSVYAETYGRTAGAVQQLLPGASEKQIEAAGKNVFWFLKLLQNVAVYQAIHSHGFNLEKASLQDLKDYSRAVAQKFWPTKLPQNFDALHEPCMWMTSIGQSRVAYLRNYFRAYSICDLAPGKMSETLKIPGEPSYHARVLAGEKPPHPLRDLKAAESRIAEKLKI